MNNETISSSIIEADRIIAYESIELRDKSDPTGSNHGLIIKRYPCGYAFIASSQNVEKNRMEFFIDKGDGTGNTSAVMTLSAGRNNNQFELRMPGDLEGIAIDVSRDGEFFIKFGPKKSKIEIHHQEGKFTINGQPIYI